MQAFIVSIMAGLILPLLPLPLEFLFRDLETTTWTATALTYSAAIGIASRNQSILIGGLIGATVLAFIYGVELSGGKMGRFPWFFGAVPAQVALTLSGLAYAWERYGRHAVEGHPFLDVRTTAVVGRTL